MYSNINKKPQVSTAKPKTLYFMRHGDTGKTGRFIGTTDIALTAHALSHLQGMRRTISRLQTTKVLCSPMWRCRQTAAALDLESRCEFNDQLREVDFGLWEGLDYQEITARYPEEAEKWLTNPAAFTFPQGESMRSFCSRVNDVAQELITAPAASTLVISHGGVIRYLLCTLLNINDEHAIKFVIEPGKITSMQLYSQGGILTGLNLTF
jgi:alpha-ribazole phosphatase